jgi:hypothetical protein
MSKYLTATMGQHGVYMTPRVRMAYPALLKPRVPMDTEGGKLKYSVTLLVPKAANIDLLHKVVADMLKAKRITKVAHPAIIETGSKDTQLREYADEFPFMIRTSANADFPPLLFYPNTTRLKREECPDGEIYGGRWCRAALRPYPYDKSGNKGVSFGLQRVQLLDSDEPIAGARVMSSEGFDPEDFDLAGKTVDDLFKEFA